MFQKDMSMKLNASLLIRAALFGIASVVAVLAGVAQKLFQSAIDIKRENDLTV